MKYCLFITGTTGSGKSTLLKRLAAMGWHTLSTGAVFRDMKVEIGKGDSPVSPEFFDTMLNETIQNFLLKHMVSSGRPCLCAIEAVPRHPRQWEWVVDAYNNGWMVGIVFMDADYHIRYGRIQSRDMARLAVDNQKMMDEGGLLSSLVQTKPPTLPMQVYDTGGWVVENAVTECEVTALTNMMTAAVNFFNSKSSHRGDLTAAHMAHRAVDELNEYLDAVKKGERKESLVTELIDSLWFNLLALVAEKMDAQQVYETFMRKFDVNNMRLDRGIKHHLDKIN